MVDKSKHIDNIKKILVGNDINHFHTQFEQLSENLDEIDQYFKNAIELSYKKLHHKLEQSTLMLEQKINNFVSDRHVEKTQLRSIIYETIETLEDQIFAQKDIFADHIKDIKKSIVDEYQEIQREIEAMQKDLNKILTIDIESVSKEKISNEIFSQTLLNGVRSIHSNKQIATHELARVKSSTNTNPLREYIEQEKQELKDLADNINQEKKELYGYLQELKEFSAMQPSTTLKVMNEDVIDVAEIVNEEKSKNSSSMQGQ